MIFETVFLTCVTNPSAVDAPALAPGLANPAEEAAHAFEALMSTRMSHPSAYVTVEDDCSRNYLN
ncbi:protein of unknown function [Pararobbsia alpina]